MPNRLAEESVVPRKALETLLLLLAPLAPHLTEELWHQLGHQESIGEVQWPSHDPSVLEEAEILWVVQVNGKVRARLTVQADIPEEELKDKALADANVKRYIDKRPIKQVIVVPKRLVNIVV